MKIHNNYTGQDLVGDVAVDDISIVYCQEMDSNGNREDMQSIKIERMNAGGGDYWTISTKRWSFDKISDLIAVLKDFNKKCKTLK